MSTLALDRRILAWAGAPLLLLAACADDAVTPMEETTAQTDTQTSDPSTSSTGPVDPSTSVGPSTSSGPEPETTGTTASVDDSTTSGPITATGPGTTGEISVCGNNIIEGDELCDLAQVNGETCESLGYQGGQLGCLLTCEDYNLLGCFICCNEVIDIAEDCEGSVPEDVDCESLGFQDGFVTCGDDCLYDLSECSICGDGIQSGFEQCDGIDFGGSTCASVGFDGGNLACNLAQCAFVYSGCFGGQYIQNFEAGMNMPPEFDVDAGSPWTVSNSMPINDSQSARSGNVAFGGVTNLTLQTSFPAAGTISFYHREQTLNGCEFLEFYRDGVQQQSWTGNLAAAQYMAPVPAGNHTFQWRFNAFGCGGTPAVWVDDITLSGGVPL